MTRHDMIIELKNYGKHWKFSRLTDAQLYSILNKERKQIEFQKEQLEKARKAFTLTEVYNVLLNYNVHIKKPNVDPDFNFVNRFGKRVIISTSVSIEVDDLDNELYIRLDITDNDVYHTFEKISLYTIEHDLQNLLKIYKPITIYGDAQLQFPLI